MSNYSTDGFVNHSLICCNISKTLICHANMGGAHRGNLQRNKNRNNIFLILTAGYSLPKKVVIVAAGVFLFLTSVFFFVLENKFFIDGSSGELVVF